MSVFLTAMTTWMLWVTLNGSDILVHVNEEGCRDPHSVVIPRLDLTDVLSSEGAEIDKAASPNTVQQIDFRRLNFSHLSAVTFEGLTGSRLEPSIPRDSADLR